MTHRPVRLLVFVIFDVLLALNLVLLLWLGWRPDVPAVVMGVNAFMAWALERGWG